MLFIGMKGILSFAQPAIQIDATSMVGTTDSLPFWFMQNQFGMYDLAENSNQHLSLGIIQDYKSIGKSNSWEYTYGTRVAANYSHNFNHQFNELFAGIAFKNWQLKAGLFRDSIELGGLSTTNGNIVRSINARPYPMLRYGTNGFVKSPILKKYISFSATYDEGFFDEERYVEGFQIHHKSLYFKTKTSASFNFIFGLEHYVMWGGTSPNYGEMPEDFKSYLVYVTGGTGTSDMPLTDQQNVAGNQYGSYLIRLEKKYDQGKFIINFSHPFDDKSGMTFKNWRDNVISFYWENNDQQKLFSNIIYEFTNTRNQSLTKEYRENNLHYDEAQTIRWHDDRYYDHGVYRGGVTYKGYAIVSPLFNPVVRKDDMSYGFESTRFFAHHIGWSGKINSSLTWKGMFTYLEHLGNYYAPIEPHRKMLASILAFQYSNIEKLPFDLKLSLGYDYKDYADNSLGIQIGISKCW